MSLTSGSRLGVYEITGKLGEGGMGEVWRAHDTKLNRDVALKVLPEAFAGDADRLARFTREAQVLASLNHPNIAAIYGIEGPALVMELVEGDDLSQRIARGAIPFDEALPIATQIAEALEAAHEQGVVHRDLKPANIKVRADGTVKVLDFGLAKAMDQGAGLRDQGSGGAANSPTITTPAMTQAGMILGTAAYMAPEQAKGIAVDKRADIWAFGVVLYEMLTGRRLFSAETTPETLARVLTREVDVATLPATTPRHIRTLLARCLVKEPKQRLRDIGDARLMLSGSHDPDPVGASGNITSSQRVWPLVALAVAAAVVVALAIPAVRSLREMLPPEMRLEITTPATSVPLQFTLSPDGRHIVFVASGDGRQRLWLRPLDQTEAKPLPGTEGAGYPFWSPDSRAIGFFAADKLLRIDIAGGPPQFLVSVNGLATGGSWSGDGTILYPQQTTSPLWRIAAAGGRPVAVTRLVPPLQVAHRFPHFLPDGRHFLFYVQGAPEAAGLYLGSLDDKDPKRLTPADSAGQFLAPDRVIFVRQGVLLAQRLDLGRGELVGEPVTVADRVGVDGNNFAGFAVSGHGQVAYRAGGDELQQLTWFDRTGKAVGVAGEPDPSNPRFPELSLDGQRVAMVRAPQSNGDIWLMNLVRGGLTRLTFDAASDINGIWSPDGTRVAFASNRKGAFDVYAEPSNGSGNSDVLLETANTKMPQAWSADGRFLLYYEFNPKTGRDLLAMDLTSAEHRSRVVANTPAEEVLAEFSPDGRWVAYQTNESGRFEVVVQPFPDAGGKWQLSTGGGVAPRWRADGKEVYFIAPDATMMAVPVTVSGATLEAGTPVSLFSTRIVGGGALATNRPNYAVARDGRFLINQPVGDAAPAPITLILNWNAAGKK